jgi:TPR repeat protein
MPRIIFKCGYIKNAAEHAENLVLYVATREGVEKIPQNRRDQPATQKQILLIGDILTQFPDSDRLFEYEDYQNNPTLENASEFITAALDQNLDQLSHQEVYVNYIATRPRAERLGTHGLFSDENSPLVLSQVAEEVARHPENIWTPIISLRREDAARLGYDNAAAWMELLRKQRNVLAEQMKIAPENLRWYAAFHNEGHHPHCHMIVYSVNPREGYVTKPAIEKMRSSLAREIFQQDLLQIYSEQTALRDPLTVQNRDTLWALLEKMQTGTCENPVIENLMFKLAERLQYTSGKKQYGYLKAPLKELVNQIVDELAKDERVAVAYAKWYELRNEVLRTYKDELPEPFPLSQQKEFKQIKNMVIAEAVNLSGHRFTFEGDETAGLSSEEDATEDAVSEPPLPEPEPVSAETAGDQEDIPSDIQGRTLPPDSDGADSGKPYIAWNKRYKSARTFLYGSDDTEPDFDQALQLFLEEAADGNALAMHDLGRMYADGLGVEMNTGTAFTWYAKALSAFMDIEAEKENRYVEYRIGKMYAAGLGTEKDYEEASGWLGEAVSKNHKYAQYSLAGLYYRGQGVERDYRNAFRLYQKSARQRVPYASYELEKMYRDGVGTAVNTEESQLHFEEAFFGFKGLEEQSHDDKLQYRLGQMLYTGTGTEKDVGAAVGYFEKAARLGNVHAQYMLGKIYLDANSGHENVAQAILWLTRSANLGNQFAQYTLAKLYLAGEDVPKDVPKALELFQKSAEQGNQHAQYQLGKIFLLGEDVPKDVDTAIRWLTASAEQGNQYAQYALGKLYLIGNDVPRDREAAVRWLTLSAEQGNIYARFFLDHLDSFRDPLLFLTATRLLHHMSRIFREEQEKLPGGPHMRVESKLRRKIRQKKIAQGHALDDHEQKLIIY